MKSRFEKQIEQLRNAKTHEEIKAIVQANGGFDRGGIMHDPAAERAAIEAGILLYMAQGLGFYVAAQGSELLFYPKANPVWEEKIREETAKRNEEIIRRAAEEERNAPPRTIDKARLKAAAEHLEWVLLQYPDSAILQGLLRSLGPLIDAAKAGTMESVVGMNDVPGAYNFGDRLYSQFTQPNVENAYTQFRVEIRGGHTEQEKRQIAEMEAYRQSLLENKHE